MVNCLLMLGGLLSSFLTAYLARGGNIHAATWDFPGGPVAKTPNAGGLGLIPGQGTRSHILQLKILHAATNSCCCQINKLKKKKKGSIAKIISSRAWTQI